MRMFYSYLNHDYGTSISPEVWIDYFEYFIQVPFYIVHITCKIRGNILKRRKYFELFKKIIRTNDEKRIMFHRVECRLEVTN